jgi:hypothetical protein
MGEMTTETLQTTKDKADDARVYAEADCWYCNNGKPHPSKPGTANKRRTKIDTWGSVSLPHVSKPRTTRYAQN